MKTNDTYADEKPNYVKKPKNVRTSIVSFADDDLEESLPQSKNLFMNFAQPNQ
jgi:hypothetical protein